MKIKSLYPIIVTDNIDESIKYYTDLMDFKIKHDATRKDGGRVVVLENELGLEIELMSTYKQGEVVVKNGLNGFRMNVDDFDEAYQEIVDKGYQVIAGPLTTPTAKSVILKDKNGVNITIMKHLK